MAKLERPASERRKAQKESPEEATARRQEEGVSWGPLQKTFKGNEIFLGRTYGAD